MPETPPHQATSQRMQRYQGLWQRLIELFPSLELDFEENRNTIITFEPYRHTFHNNPHGNGYMTWLVNGVNPDFWKKVVAPLLGSLKDLGVKWRASNLNPEAFVIRLPFSRKPIAEFRLWVETGKLTVEPWEYDFDPDSFYDDDDYDIDDMGDGPSEYEEDGFFNKRRW